MTSQTPQLDALVQHLTMKPSSHDYMMYRVYIHRHADKDEAMIDKLHQIIQNCNVEQRQHINQQLQHIVDFLSQSVVDYWKSNETMSPHQLPLFALCGDITMRLSYLTEKQQNDWLLLTFEAEYIQSAQFNIPFDTHNVKPNLIHFGIHMPSFITGQSNFSKVWLPTHIDFNHQKYHIASIENTVQALRICMGSTVMDTIYSNIQIQPEYYFEIIHAYTEKLLSQYFSKPFGLISSDDNTWSWPCYKINQLHEENMNVGSYAYAYAVHFHALNKCNPLTIIDIMEIAYRHFDYQAVLKESLHNEEYKGRMGCVLPFKIEYRISDMCLVYQVAYLIRDNQFCIYRADNLA